MRKLGRTPSPVLNAAKPKVINRSNYAFIHPTESGQWLFVPAKKCRWSAKDISMSVEPDDPTDGPILSNIKIGSKVFVAYGFDVAECKLVDRIQLSEGGARQWDLMFEIEKFDFAPPFEINFGGSPNELAEKRARRILLNENPATETRDINKALIEHYTAGQGTPFSIKKSILPELFKQYDGDPERFLSIAWICALALLKLSGAVAEVMHLELALEGDALKVEFRGNRRKEYVNQPAYEINIKGQCSLTSE